MTHAPWRTTTRCSRPAAICREWARASSRRSSRGERAAMTLLGGGVVEGICGGREVKPFATVEEFFARVNHRHLNKRGLESMVKAGAFDSLCGAARGGLRASPDRG